MQGGDKHQFHNGHNSILKKVEIGKFITTALTSILKLVKNIAVQSWQILYTIVQQAEVCN